MTSDEQGRQTAPPAKTAGRTGRPQAPKRLYLILLVIAAVVALLVVPPLISIGRYKSRITQVISQSFGRPVRLASVELRLLPWPGFVLTDLSVAEDPAYGSEPVLHANTVTANIRLLSLWRGRLEISSVSVDEASLNVVRATPGHWNLDPHLPDGGGKGRARTSSGQPHRFPYLEATNSRINFKDGAEKLPFSLVNTDLSLWQESPGEWRLRLRGQPARTDVALDMGDTGIVRLEASVHRAPELRQMPLHVDIDWRQAQLGQLSRLLIGYDPGWRGDLTGELHLDGTPDAAKVTTRLRATGVHRAEFAPVSPLDFDANCGFVYHYSRRALDNLVCNSPLGDGRLHLTGDMPGGDAAPNLTVELDHISAGAGLDVLRTLRSGINPDLEAGGNDQRKAGLRQEQPENQGDREPANKGTRNATRRGHARAVAQGPLTGSLTVEGFALSGGGLSQPLRVPRMVLEPAVVGAGTLATGVWNGRAATGRGRSRDADGNHGDSRRRHGAAGGESEAGALRIRGGDPRTGEHCAGARTGPNGRPGRRLDAGRSGRRAAHGEPDCRRAMDDERDRSRGHSRNRSLPFARRIARGAARRPRRASARGSAAHGIRSRRQAAGRQHQRHHPAAQRELARRLSGEPCADRGSHAAPGRRRAALGSDGVFLRAGKGNGER